MKILSVAWAIYDPRIEEFCGNCTGAGLVIKNLCEQIGKSEESYLFLGQYDIPNIKLGNIHIVTNISERDSNSDEKRMDRLVTQFENILKIIKPDIVNIHGIGELAIRCIYACQKYGIPHIFIEHLYIGLNKPFEMYDRDVIWEKELYNIPNLKIVAVSTGVKKKIQKDFKNISSENIFVIKNGTDFTAEIMHSDLKKKYAIDDKKVLLCVGNISQRKNQLQLIDTFMMLPGYVKEKIVIMFCGIDRMGGRLVDCIKRNNLETNMIYAGAVSSEEMNKYYSIADGLIIPSLAEGLSIAALEAIAYGLPLIMLSESECANDLGDEKVSILCDTRECEDISKSIVQWYKTKWDKKYIINFSKQFTMERMADEYINLNIKLSQKDSIGGKK